MGNLGRRVAFCFGMGLSLLITACGGGKSTPPPPTTYTLTVNSTDPASGVAITVSPADANGAGNGTTSFMHTYDAGTSVTLTAPTTSGGNNFTSWTGCTSASTVTCTVAMSASATVTANYATPPPTTYTLTVNSTNPASGVAITVSPVDVNSASNGATSFTRTYDSGTSVTLTAPATSGGNTFSSWTGCTSASTVTCTVAMSANTTVTANYATPPPTTYTLTVDSTNPASGVAITVSPADVNSASNGTTAFTRTYNSGTSVTLTAPATSGGNNFTSWTGCTSASTVTCMVTLSANTTVTANYATPTFVLTVDSTNPASGVAITVSPVDVNSASNGSTSFTRTYNSGTSVTLTAPATSGSNTFSSWSGGCTSATVTCTVAMSANKTVTANYTVGLITPTVTVTPSASSVTTAQPMTVTVVVSGGAGNPTPTGTVTLTSPGYFSAATALTSGSAQIDIAAGALPAGSDILKATYSPDLASASIYNGTSGTSSAVSVTSVATVTVDQSSDIATATDQILGMNLAAWYDVASSTNEPAIQTAFGDAGIKAVRWPGGSWSDAYNWETNNECGNYANSNDDFTDFVDNLVIPAGLDLALTADYGTGKNCTGPGDPTEAAAWVADALTLGVTVSHMTVGNEEYGSWETDNHTPKNNGATYAAAVGSSTSNGYYEQIKTASPSTLVGVDVEPNYAPWDQDVMSGASYDFVEYHYYPETPGQESDSFITKTAAQQLTTNINKIKTELTNWGTPGTPIYVGEIGGPYSNPGKQSWSITQGLYAGQVLGEMMNDGVSRLTWWIGFGNCNGTAGNDSASLYGWQDFGAYNIFSDGPSETACPGAGPMGTMSPTAEAFNLFQNVAVTGETVQTATVAGDTTDVRAYAATHSGGTALVLFNLNETASSQVTVTLSTESNSPGVTVITYDKSIYDQTDATPPVWATPTTTSLGTQTLPLTLTLTPWSMNVILIQ